MNRRRYLATGATFASVALAGCTVRGAETILANPIEEHDPSCEERCPGVVHYVHEHQDEEVVVVSFDERSDDVLRVEIHQPGEIARERVRLEFESDRERDDSVQLYPEPPQAGHAEEVDVHRTGRRTVLELSEAGSGTGSTVYHLLAHSLVHDVEVLPLVVDYEITLSEAGLTGESFVARNRTTLTSA